MQYEGEMERGVGHDHLSGVARSARGLRMESHNRKHASYSEHRPNEQKKMRKFWETATQTAVSVLMRSLRHLYRNRGSSSSKCHFQGRGLDLKVDKSDDGG